MKSELAIRGFKLNGLAVILHPRARPAYHSISALPQFLPLTELGTPALLDSFKQSPLSVVAPQLDQSSILIVGGFRAFHILGALALIGKMPKRLDVRLVEDDPAAITATVQAELLSALMRHPARIDSRALASVIRLLTDENAAAIFGDIRPSRRSISDLTGISFADLAPAKRFSTGSNSDILSNVLGGNR